MFGFVDILADFNDATIRDQDIRVSKNNNIIFLVMLKHGAVLEQYLVTHFFWNLNKATKMIGLMSTIYLYPFSGIGIFFVKPGVGKFIYEFGYKLAGKQLSTPRTNPVCLTVQETVA
jgi:hypothetical protein